MKEKLLIIIMLMLFIWLSWLSGYQKVQYNRKIKILTTMAPQDVTIFRIYPRVIRPVGTSKAFKVPDPIIDDFFRSLTDLRSYRPTHDTVIYREHNWFLGIATKDTIIQIHFRIPSGKGDIVAGQLNGLGWFQSGNLFPWYRKYKDRWLEPERKEGSEEGEKKRRAEEQKLGR